MKYGTLQQGPLVYITKDGNPIEMISAKEGGINTAEHIARLMNKAHDSAVQEYLIGLPVDLQVHITQVLFDKI